MAAETGVTAVVAAAAREAVAQPAVEAVQPDLLPLPDGAAVEAARDARADRDPGMAVQAVRKAGRPKGALNKRTSKFRDLVLASGSHPGLALQRAYSRPVEVLAAELGCSKLEAFKVQVSAAAELLPYVEGKQPVSIEVAGKATAVIAIPGLNMPMMGVDEAADLLDERGIEAIDWDAAVPGQVIDAPAFSSDGGEPME